MTIWQPLLFVTLFSSLTACVTAENGNINNRNTDPAALQNVTWSWFETITPAKKTTVHKPENYTLTLLSDGSLQAKFDCNRGGGRYSLNNEKIRFEQMFSTRMACPPNSQDNAYMQDLNLVVSFYTAEDILFLEMPIGSGVMKFKKLQTDKP